MKVVVMGAGLAGVTTAWMLARDGHQVTVLEREPRVAAGASFANGGIVAASRPFPWSGEGARVRAVLDPWLWGWGLKHLACRGPRRQEQILARKARLLRYSQEKLAALVAETGIEYRRLTNGVLYLYRDAEALERRWQRAQSARSFGVRTERLSPEAVCGLEPGLDGARIAGALYAPDDEAGDSGLFCRELALRCERLGVVFRLGSEVLGVDALDTTVQSAVTRAGRVLGDAFVCALGAIEPRLREGLGASLPVYPVKGFSATVALADAARAPRRAGMDESRRLAWCPLGDAIRITGGAELAGHATTHRPEDFDALFDAFGELFPGAADFSAARKRACLRPMTPESTPRFGTGRYTNLWFNVGHGHMGWAMAAGSARITADLVAGRSPEIDLEGLRLRR